MVPEGTKKSFVSSFVLNVACRVKSLHCGPIWPIETSCVLFEPFIFICCSDEPAPDRYALGGLICLARTLKKSLRFSRLSATQAARYCTDLWSPSVAWRTK